jgi:hypothetical protein
MMKRILVFGVMLIAGAAHGQISGTSPNGLGVPTHGIYCMDALGNANVCAFGSGGSGGPLTYGGSPVSSTNPLGTSDLLLDGLANGAGIPVSIGSAPLPALAAKDGTDATGVTPPTGASGIRGWLSGIYNRLVNGTTAVSLAAPVTTTPVSVTPIACANAAVTTGGTAVTASSGTIHGGWITNPLAAGDQNIATAESLYVNLVTTATANGRGTNNLLQPGGSIVLPAQTTSVSVVAATSAHAFTCTVY